MSRDAQSNPNSRSIHTKNVFSQHSHPFIKINKAGHSTNNKRKPSIVLLKRHSAERNPEPIIFKTKTKKDFVVTDVVLNNEDITVALAYVVAIYTQMTNNFLVLCWRIATALAIPNKHSLEMNSLLSVLLERHCKMPKMLSESTETTNTPTEDTSTPSPPTPTATKTENEEHEFLLNYKLKMYEV